MTMLPWQYKGEKDVNRVFNLFVVERWQLKGIMKWGKGEKEITWVKITAPDLSISFCISCRTERAIPLSGDQ
jgi:hypothetical protein